jgi:hypothetical protein
MGFKCSCVSKQIQIQRCILKRQTILKISSSFFSRNNLFDYLSYISWFDGQMSWCDLKLENFVKILSKFKFIRNILFSKSRWELSAKNSILEGFVTWIVGHENIKCDYEDITGDHEDMMGGHEDIIGDYENIAGDHENITGVLWEI